MHYILNQPKAESVVYKLIEYAIYLAAHPIRVATSSFAAWLKIVHRRAQSSMIIARVFWRESGAVFPRLWILSG